MIFEYRSHLELKQYRIIQMYVLHSKIFRQSIQTIIFVNYVLFLGEPCRDVVTPIMDLDTSARMTTFRITGIIKSP